ncbi:hypothetical protein EFP25_00580 [Lactiplantibacillus pentosus]|uniref:AAA family ATPase n=2 Tax=Lactiplantibacillus pentosus TaxID=1589 RepID=UPI00067AC6BD|nr:AAA family ATPase [Lactiplantibacillus pentosus]MCT3298139.1 hypothetical protein [Lactiplantibacillus pentosus]MCT3330092.1 hypothetical protein [Lactiplantibacillus pentosus]
MINKIFKIKNYARFNNVNSTNMPDKGIMKRVNLIYAPNGTGKTSLSLIFQSLSTKNEKLILKKKSVLVEGELEVGAILDDKAEEFKRNQWTDNLHLHKEIKVFNSYFLNDNVYTFNLNDKNFSTRDFLLKKDLPKYEKMLFDKDNLMKKELKQRRSKHNFRSRMRKRYQLNDKAFEEMLLKNKEYQRKLANIKKFEEGQQDFDQQIGLLIRQAMARFIKKTNDILHQFTKNITISDLKLVYKAKSKLNQVVFSVSVLGVKKTLDRENVGFDYTLSDGDKSALALSSFLARVSFSEDLEKQVIVIDDPFTSFDSGRKLMTIEAITNLTANVQQIILLTHDKNFLFEFANNVKGIVTASEINLWQLVPSGKFVTFRQLYHSDTEGLIERTLKKLQIFLSEGESNPDRLLSIARSLRPLLEEIFRIKYPEFYEDNTWLSTYLDYIRKSENDPHYRRFAKLLPEKDLIIAVMDYTKKFNHSSSSVIDSVELEGFVKRTLEVFDNI